MWAKRDDSGRKIVVLAAMALVFTVVATSSTHAAFARTGPVGLDIGWTSSCPYTQSAWVDPIFFPGQMSMHLHDFFGTRPDENYDYDDFRNNGSECALAEDTAGYWAPSLYVPGGDGKPVQVKPTEGLVYWNGAPMGSDVQLHPFPANLKLLAGDPEAPPNSQSTDIVWFDCGPIESHAAQEPYLCSSGNEVRAHVRFPSCWDGVAPLPVGDDSSHVSYPVRGSCPHGTVKLPRIHLLISYPIQDGRGATLASGGGPNDPNSIYTLHADYFHAPDQAVHADLVDGCLNDVVEAFCGIPRTPSIEWIDPSASAPGMTVAVGGTNFNGVKSVVFNGRPATFNVQSPQRLTATVPAGTTSGIVSVTTDGGTGIDMETTGYSLTPFLVLAATDSFTRSVSGGWGTSSSGLVWKTSGGAPADYAVNGREGRMNLPVLNSPRLAYLSVPLADQEAVVRFSSSKMPKSMRFDAHVVGRYLPTNGSFYSIRASLVWDGSVRVSATKKPAGGAEVYLGSEVNVGNIGAAAQWYWVRASFKTEGSAVRLLGKVWKRGTTEPVNWQFSYLDSSSPLLAAGMPGLRGIPWVSPPVTTLNFDDFSLLALG